LGLYLADLGALGHVHVEGRLVPSTDILHPGWTITLREGAWSETITDAFEWECAARALAVLRDRYGADPRRPIRRTS
jgi:hypothetical protein